MKVCKDCKYYIRPIRATWLSPLEPPRCGHPDAKDRVSGEPKECSHMRELSKYCGEAGIWFHEKTA